MSAPYPSDARARALREAFDHSFALSADPGRAADLDFLTVRVAGAAYALALSEVASLHANRSWLAAPSLLPELLGIASFRGVLVPVYDLAALLGSAPDPRARWLVLSRGPSAIGFAFESFVAQLRVSPDLVSAPSFGTHAANRGAVQNGAHTLPLLSLPSLVEAVVQRIKAVRPIQER